LDVLLLTASAGQDNNGQGAVTVVLFAWWPLSYCAIVYSDVLKWCCFCINIVMLVIVILMILILVMLMLILVMMAIIVMMIMFVLIFLMLVIMMLTF
jgi:hypothetical protein